MNSRDYRDALGRFATGVAIVTATAADGTPIGMTINSFTSVSLEPRLVLWCIGKDSPRLTDYSGSNHFAIAILNQQQQALASTFATPLDDKFAGVEWHPGVGGVPVIDEMDVVFECHKQQQYDAGDHLIFLCEVEQFHHRPATPLVYCGGQFVTTQPLPLSE